MFFLIGEYVYGFIGIGGVMVVIEWWIGEIIVWIWGFNVVKGVFVDGKVFLVDEVG